METTVQQPNNDTHATQHVVKNKSAKSIRKQKNILPNNPDTKAIQITTKHSSALHKLLKRTHKKKQTKDMSTQTQALIKKGFILCRALDNYIKASQRVHSIQ